MTCLGLAYTLPFRGYHARNREGGHVPNTEESLVAGSDDWSHETVIDGEPPRATTRAFVSHHLTAHGLHHIVDIVQLVARDLAASALLRSPLPLTLILSKSGDVVRFQVRSASQRPHPTAEAEGVSGVSHPSAFIKILSLQWGRAACADTQSVWVTFDARPQRHAIHAARRATGFARGHVPGVQGTHTPE